MADNLCGPSNAAKRLQEHVGRDNSLQQDRFTKGPQDSQSFRTPTASVSANTDFNAFMNAPNAPLAPHSNPLLDGFMQPAQHGFQQPFNGQGFPSNPLHAHQTASWVNQFNHMNLDNSIPAAHTNMISPMAAPLAPQNEMVNSMVPSYARGRFVPGFNTLSQAPMSYISPMAQHSMLRDPAMSSAHSMTSQHAAPLISEADLEAKFAQFEAEELAAQSYTQSHKDVLEESSQPQVEPDSLTNPIVVESKPLEIDTHMQTSDANPLIDQDLERQRNAERLRQIAGDIVDTTQGQGAAQTRTPDKFRNSNFLALMTRIHRGDVVLNNDSTNLVDAKTGESADQTMPDHIKAVVDDEMGALKTAQGELEVS